MITLVLAYRVPTLWLVLKLWPCINISSCLLTRSQINYKQWPDLKCAVNVAWSVLPCTTPWRHWGSGGIAPPILNLCATWRYVSFIRGCSRPRERAFSFQWRGGWVGRRSHLDSVEMRKQSCSSQDSNPEPSSRWPGQYIDCTMPAQMRWSKLMVDLRFCQRCYAASTGK